MRGYTLLELMIVLAIASILALAAKPILVGGIDCKKQRITGFVTKAHVANAIGEVGSVHLKVQMYLTHHRKLPDSIDELNLGNDRWGNPYQFLDHRTVNGNGPKRKAWSNVPVNRQYDIYSMGPDGKTATPMTSTPGGDDIVLAQDGQYIGVACLYPKPKGGK